MARPMTVVKWTALVLYSAIIAAWVVAGAISFFGVDVVAERLVMGAPPKSPVLLVLCTVCYWIFLVVHFPPYVTYGLLACMLALQALLLLGTGLKEPARPLSRRRMLIPLFVFALTAAMLAFALLANLWELVRTARYWHYGDLEAGHLPLAGLAVMSLTTIGWLCSCALMYFRLRDADRYRVLRNVTVAVILASVAIAVVSIGVGLFMTRYGTSLTDMPGDVSLLALWISIFVFLWAAGVAVVLLFVREQWYRVRGQGASSQGP